MHTSVDLQDPFSFSFLLTMILLALVILPAIIFAIMKLKGVELPKFKRKPKPKPAPRITKVGAEELKRRYLEIISKIETDYKSNRIDDREAHQRLSSAVRGFVNERTGVKVSNYSLKELEFADMPELYTLIKEFYTPEFAFGTDAEDTEGSIRNAKEVISKWN